MITAMLAVASLVAAFVVGRSFPVESPSVDGVDLQPAVTVVSAAPGAQTGTPDIPVATEPTHATLSDAWEAPTAAERTLAILGVLDRCRTDDDFLATVDSIQARVDKSEKQRFLALLFSAWLETDPLAALSEVRRVELLRHNAGRVAERFRTWASRNPDEAAELLGAVLDGRQTDAADRPPFLDGVDPPDFILSLVSGLGSSNPRLAADVLADVAGSPLQRSGIEVLLQDWYPADPAAVREWAASIVDPESRRIALAAAATKGGQQELVAPALSWAADLPAEADRDVALRALTVQWSRRHAADAFAWCRELPDGQLKFSLMPAVIRQLVLIDPGAAADWLNRYEAGPDMDASIAAYARGVQSRNPPAAMGSAAAITDPRLRGAVMRRLSRNQHQGLPIADESGVLE